MRLFTLFSYLITKESYNLWITRRKWGFRHQISEAKNLKMSVANIWKHSGAYRRRTSWLRNHFAACEIGLQLGVIGFQWLLLLHFNFDLCTIWSVGLLTSRALKWHIVWIKWTLGTAPKVSNSWCLLGFFMLDFSLCFHPCIHDLFMAKDYKAPKLEFFT